MKVAHIISLVLPTEYRLPVVTNSTKYAQKQCVTRSILPPNIPLPLLTDGQLKIVTCDGPILVV